MSAIGRGEWVQAIKSVKSIFGAEIVEGRVYCVEALISAGSSFMSHTAPCAACAHPVGARLLGVAARHFEAWCVSCELRPLGGNARSETRQAPAELETA